MLIETTGEVADWVYDILENAGLDVEFFSDNSVKIRTDGASFILTVEVE